MITKKSIDEKSRIGEIFRGIGDIVDKIRLMGRWKVLNLAQRKQLLPSIRILATGVRSQDYRSCLEAEKVTETVNSLLVEWGILEAQRLEAQVVEEGERRLAAKDLELNWEKMFRMKLREDLKQQIQEDKKQKGKEKD